MVLNLTLFQLHRTHQPSTFINFSESVQSLNIRGEASSAGAFRAPSGESEVCQESIDIQHVSFLYSTALGSGHRGSFPSAGFVQRPLMSGTI